MCAIFGLIDYNHTLNAKQREKVLRVLSHECEERGTDATGYAYNSRGKRHEFLSCSLDSSSDSLYFSGKSLYMIACCFESF